jgi:hypothetical protein
MATILERIYKLTVDAATAERALAAIAKSTASVDKQFAALGDGIKKFAAGVGIGFVAKEIVDNFRAVVDAMDDTLKASQKLGISVESLQEWQFALKLSGVESGTFATAGQACRDQRHQRTKDHRRDESAHKCRRHGMTPRNRRRNWFGFSCRTDRRRPRSRGDLRQSAKT